VSQLIHLRQKIKSVQSTKKITHAVRLVSMSLYNKLEKLDKPLSQYAEAISNEFILLLSHAADWRHPVLFPDDTLDSRPLIIIAGTSKGLCGSLNSNLFRHIETSLTLKDHQKPHFVVIGQRAIKYVVEKNLGEIFRSYTELNSNNFIAIADDLINTIIKSDQPYSSVTFFNNKAHSFFSQKPQALSLIPMPFDLLREKTAKATVEEEDDNSFSEVIWEQDREEILNYLVIRYLRSSIIRQLFQGLRAEYAARFLAMENSTNSAEKILENLTRKYNKLRQSLITREITELAASFPAR